MMLYEAGRGIDPGKINVRLNPGTHGQFAVIELAGTSGAALFIMEAADADALIKAAVEAKSLLLTAQHYSPEQMAELNAPVITDSDRTCDQANPDSGAWCHRDGDHAEHRDTNGDTWRTDEPGFKDADAPERCEDEAGESGKSFFCTLNAGHAGLHAQLTPTGAFMAEWGYADGHVHTTAEQPASVTL
jgi:hypothetical protein